MHRQAGLYKSGQVSLAPKQLVTRLQHSLEIITVTVYDIAIVFMHAFASRAGLRRQEPRRP